VRLRVATYNAQMFRGSVEAAVRALEPERPELLLVQECGSRRRLRRFAAAMGLEVVSSHRPFNRVRNAILYPTEWRLAGFEAHDLTREGRMLRRGFIVADLRRRRLRLAAVSAHLGLGARERIRHARELTDYLGGVHGALVVGLDLNEGPEGDAARWIAGRLYDAWPIGGGGGGATFPARSPTVRIDYVFMGDGVEVSRAWVAEGPVASDHLPVLADVVVAEGRA
jgi:endonuclease/exonuclease/phosphatase family metal-dependent hydrolase